MFPTRLSAILAALLLSHGTAAFPTLDSTSITTWAENLIPLRWIPHARLESKQNLAKRQGQGDGTAFDRNPDGSTFLWVLQDTYEGETFFE